MPSGLILCVIYLGTNVGKEEVMCFYYDMNFATVAADLATCNIMALSYRGDLGLKQMCIKTGVMDNAEDLLNMHATSCNM